MVLPAPLGPTSPIRSPSAIEASIESRMTNVPTSRETPDEPKEAHGSSVLASGTLAARGVPATDARAAARPWPRSCVGRARLARGRPPPGVEPEGALAGDLRPAPPGAAQPADHRSAGSRPRSCGPAAGSRWHKEQKCVERAPDHDPLDRPSAAWARLSGPLVDLKALLHRAVAIGRRVVVDRAAAPLDGLRQDRADGLVEASLVGRTQRADAPERVEAGGPQSFVRVDVADSGDERLIEQERLEPTRRAAATAAGTRAA